MDELKPEIGKLFKCKYWHSVPIAKEIKLPKECHARISIDINDAVILLDDKLHPYDEFGYYDSGINKKWIKALYKKEIVWIILDKIYWEKSNTNI